MYIQHKSDETKVNAIGNVSKCQMMYRILYSGMVFMLFLCCIISDSEKRNDRICASNTGSGKLT